jgi:hypothetical protein
MINEIGFVDAILSAKMGRAHAIDSNLSARDLKNSN